MRAYQAYTTYTSPHMTSAVHCFWTFSTFCLPHTTSPITANFRPSPPISAHFRPLLPLLILPVPSPSLFPLQTILTSISPLTPHASRLLVVIPVANRVEDHRGPRIPRPRALPLLHRRRPLRSQGVGGRAWTRLSKQRGYQIRGVIGCKD